jgi:hypothetical protein
LKTNKLKVFLEKYWPQILFVVTVLIGYGQIVFFQTTFKFDAIYNHLPWRQLIVDNLRHGNLPLWNYYHSLGTPIHADPQSGAWYPIVWIISLFGSYDLLVYNLEFVVHVIIAGLGIQFLFRTLSYSRHYQYLGSVAYVFSGFFASNSMFFTWIISAAWIPYIISGFIILWRKPSIYHSLFTALFIFMLLSGGYPAFAIILVYLMGFLLIWKLIKVKKNNLHQSKQIILYTLLTIALSVILSIVVLVSVAQVIPFMPRGAPATIADAAIPPFLPENFLSLLLPYPFVKLEYPESIRFDGTNIYLGLISLFLLVSVFFDKKALKRVSLILFGSFVFFAIAFGREFGLYDLVFNYLPGINYFRFPTLFRYFGMLGLLVAIGNIFMDDSINILKKPLILVGFIALIFFIIAFFKSQGIVKPENQSLYEWVVGFTFWNKTLFQSGFQLLMILIFAFIIFVEKRFKKQIIFILIISSIEMLIAFNIYMPYTITSFKSNPVESNKVLHSKVLDFSLEHNENIKSNSLSPDSTYLYSYFMFIYKKVVSDKGNTFELTNFKDLKLKKPDLYYKLIDNPLFYLADEVFSYRQMDSISNVRMELKRTLFLTDLRKRYIHQSNSDSSKLYLKEFDYNRIRLNIITHGDKNLVFMQNIYPGWKAKVDGKSQHILVANTSFMSIYLPAGTHEVVFYFEPNLVIVSFWISLISFFMLIIILIYLHFSSKIIK